MEIPKEFYTVDTLFTLGGSATAVWLITSIITSNVMLKKWIGLALSLIFSFLGATLVIEQSYLKWVVAFVNGFLIYSTAVGINTIASPTSRKTTDEELPIRETAAVDKLPESRLFERWW